MRTCLGCKKAKSKDKLLRLILNTKGELEPDFKLNKGGRGAYVCKDNPECMKLALEKKVFTHVYKRENIKIIEFFQNSGSSGSRSC
ncbi:hypothetical protein A3J78_00055 [Candidatus Beckwithbacteria bacterium RBG_13_35_6]|uniref:YlxR domain-containing protein n=1 Tax=Candidatus Beckwithbacteria bacterium RBG_13_35_6 TaxID=1797456 RepID=A0A1F5DGV1_9BACT|nr:MAG: hypothetical protein A3J78_00055 [Candidatus Beckwithbacteria bacterium RBG_13_35_6]